MHCVTRIMQRRQPRRTHELINAQNAIHRRTKQITSPHPPKKNKERPRHQFHGACRDCGRGLVPRLRMAMQPTRNLGTVTGCAPCRFLWSRFGWDQNATPPGHACVCNACKCTALLTFPGHLSASCGLALANLLASKPSCPYKMGATLRCLGRKHLRRTHRAAADVIIRI